MNLILIVLTLLLVLFSLLNTMMALKNIRLTKEALEEHIRLHQGNETGRIPTISYTSRVGLPEK